MSEKHAEWKARAAECHQSALSAMQRAGNMTDREMKAEYLRLATELLKLADDIEKFLADAGEEPVPN
jgi:hypothetical protein